MHWGCACTGEDYAAPECVTASALSEQAEIRQGVLRIATAALRASSDGELSSPELVQAIRRDAAPHNREDLVIGCLAARGAEWLADIWGARRSWPFHRTLEFAETLRQLLTDTLKARAHGQDASSAAGSLRLYQQAALDLHQRAPTPTRTAARSAPATWRVLPVPASRRKHPATPRRAERLEGRPHPRRVSGQRLPGDAGNVRHHDRIRDPRPKRPIPGPASRRPVLCTASVAAESPAWPPWTRQQFVRGLITQHDSLPPHEDPAQPPASEAAC